MLAPSVRVRLSSQKPGTSIMAVRASQSLSERSPGGTRAPLHVTAAGKLFLLEQGPARLRDYAKRTGLAPQTRNTLSSVPLLERELERIQRLGWAADDEEAELGVRCVAAGIRDDGSALVAALSLSCPAERMQPQWGPLVKETAARISHAIGHRPGSRLDVA